MCQDYGACGCSGPHLHIKCRMLRPLQDISRNVWSVANPGYLERPSHFKSSAQADFGWDEAEVEAMRQQVGRASELCRECG